MNLPLFLIVAGTLAAAHFSGVAIGRFLGRTAGAVDATELDAYRNALGFVEGVAPSALMLTSDDVDVDGGQVLLDDVTADRIDDRDLTEFFNLEDDEDIFDLQTWELVGPTTVDAGPAETVRSTDGPDPSTADDPALDAAVAAFFAGAPDPAVARGFRPPRRRRGRRNRRQDAPATTVITVPVGGEQLLLTIHD